MNDAEFGFSVPLAFPIASGNQMQLGKASETESASLLLVTRPNNNPRDVKAIGVLLITADIPPKALILLP
jgi:hypothetical protein